MILFHDDIQKEDARERALRELRSFLNQHEPKLARFLVNTWRSQGKAITYKELREALMHCMMGGNIEEVRLFQQLFDEWQQDYARFVVEVVAPIWKEAIEAATNRIRNKYPAWSFDATRQGIAKWVEDAGAIFVTNSTSVQIAGVKELVRRAALVQDLNVDTLAQAIRPIVGLTKQQTRAAMNYYETLRGNMSEKRAMDMTARYAARMHRYRAYNIARTELAFAYNRGADMYVREAIEAGLMGETVKIWCTADDERVCKYCGSLEGKVITMEQEFDFVTRLTYPGIRKMPPAHPSCRCAVIYDEVSPPVF